LFEPRADAGTVTHLPTACSDNFLDSLSERLDVERPWLTVAIDDLDAACTPLDEVFLSRCLQRNPDRIRIVASARTRISGLSHVATSSLSEVGPKDLSLTSAEIAMLMAEPVDGVRAQSLFARTGGWPLAVRLALPGALFENAECVPVSDHEPARRVDLADIAAEEMLRKLPPEHQALLIQSAFLERFNPDLLAELLGQKGSWRLCDELNRRHFLIVRLEVDDWYEALPCIRRAAFARLRREGGVDVKSLQLQAADWFLRTGDLHAALKLAVAAKAFEKAAAMLLEAGGVFLALSRSSDDLRLALSILPKEQCHSDMRLLLAGAFLMLREGQVAMASELVRSVAIKSSLERAGGDALLARDLAFVQASIGVLTARVAQADPIEVIRASLDEIGGTDCRTRGPLHHRMAVVHFRAGELSLARGQLQLARYYYESDSAFIPAGYADILSGLIMLEMGETPRSAQYFQRAFDVFAGATPADSRGIALSHIYLAEVNAETGKMAEAREHFAQGAAVLGGDESMYEFRTAAAYVQSLILVKTDGAKMAVTALKQHEQIARACGMDALERFLALRRMQVELISADIDAPASREGIWSLSCAAYSQKERDLGNLILPWIALANDAEVEALVVLQAQISQCAQRGARKSEMQMQLMAAVLNHVLGHAESALDALQRALAIAAETGLVRAFDDMGAFGPELLKLLIALRKNALSEAELTLIGALVLRDPTVIDGRFALTARERDVFQLVGAGRSNKLIARDLDVTPDTVRYHLKHVYEKLGTNDRSIIRRLARAEDGDPGRRMQKALPPRTNVDMSACSADSAQFQRVGLH
jgi:LuxR family maltose regulon positive regulatory protein